MTRLNNDWEFTPEWSEEFLSGAGTYEPVRLPHTVKPANKKSTPTAKNFEQRAELKMGNTNRPP